MAFLSMNPSGSNNSLTPAQNSQMNEVFLGQIVSQIVVQAILSFDEPQSQVSNNPPQLGGGVSNNPPQNQPRPGNQLSASSSLTKEGGLSFGGGFRLGGAGAPLGLSGVGTTTINKDGYQTSGGLSVGGLSANAGVKLNSKGLSFSGGVKKAQVGQGIVGPYVGTGR